MSIPIRVLEAAVLELPADKRSRLLDRLLTSLDVDADWDEARAREADRREARIADGSAKWLPGDDVMARLQARLK